MTTAALDQSKYKYMSAIKRGNKWWVDFAFNHKRYRKPSPDNTRAGTLAYEISLRQKLARGEEINNPPEEKREKILSFESYAREWQKIYVETNCKPSGIRSKKSILNVYLIPAFGKMKLNEINGLEIEKLKAQMQKRQLSNKTINNALCVLSKCLKTAEEWEHLKSRPKIRFLKLPPQKFDYLTFEESDKMLEAAGGMWKDMILLGLHTGMRLGELIGLTWENVDFSNETLTVGQSIVRGIVGSPKSNKFRYISMTSDVREMLSRRKNDPENRNYVFPNYLGNFLNEGTCRRALHGICKEAGLRKIGWHTLRHSFASHLSQKGVNMRTIQELLGHSDLKTTMRYSHLSPVVLKEGIRVLEKPMNINLRHNRVTICDHAGENDEILEASKAKFALKLKQKQEPKLLSLCSGDGES